MLFQKPLNLLCIITVFQASNWYDVGNHLKFKVWLFAACDSLTLFPVNCCIVHHRFPDQENMTVKSTWILPSYPSTFTLVMKTLVPQGPNALVSVTLWTSDHIEFVFSWANALSMTAPHLWGTVNRSIQFKVVSVLEKLWDGSAVSVVLPLCSSRLFREVLASRDLAYLLGSSLFPH